jgi:hypothetical protein
LFARWLSVLSLAACTAEHRPPPLPPFSGQPPGPPAEVGVAASASSDTQGPTAPTTSSPSASRPTEATRAAATAEASPRAFFAIERPFRLDQRVFPKERATFLADLKDRTRWNRGGLGALSAPLPQVPGHPQPKVIIDVTGARGPHAEAEMQRALRRLFWGKVVECYGLGAYKDQKLRGKATLVLRVTGGGKITSARPRGVGLATDPAGADVVTCLANKTMQLDLPKARAASQITVEIQIAPGDEPAQPPASVLKPGVGSLDPAVIAGIVSASRGSFEACYRAAFAYAPELWGRLALRIHVTETGKLDEAFESETSFPDERVTLCVLRSARALAFPKPDGGDLRFVVPMRFWSDRSPVSDKNALPAQEKSAEGRVEQ